MELRTGEVVEREIKGDYWTNMFGIQMSQVRGTHYITNQRIVFQGGFGTVEEMEYSDIELIKKCNVGGLIRFVPTGIMVKMKNGKKHYLSVLGRKDVLTLLESKIR